ncbi:MAG TPA: hypothetical protein DDZ73_14840, partial [Gammaproteobacteria bacterium]|nr:hypothetical protein [Gammaproteobacteria bacterium]
NLTQLGDNLFGLVSLDSHNLILRLLTIPVDQFSGGGSGCRSHGYRKCMLSLMKKLARNA